MIITSDKVDMSSSRNFSWSLSQNNRTTKHGNGSLFSSSASQSFIDTYESGERYNSYSSNSSGRTGNNERLPQDYLDDFFIYSGNKAANFELAETRTDKVSQDSSASSNINTTTSSTSTSGTLADFKRNTLFSLLDLIRNFKLRSMFNYGSSSEFEGNSAVTGSTGNSFTGIGMTSSTLSNSSVLSMTNGINTMTWSVESSYSTTYIEKESTSFSSQGTVKTADGRTIDFNVNLEMSREFMETHELTYLNSYTTVLTDPLVINLSDAPASISDQTFLFDIDGDGKAEEHASLGAGSGFLALDKNNDGIINDGSELFGTASGNGFKDLAKYDTDNNGWIDEADEIYKDLKVWTKDENGKDQLISLKDADVGAIYLGSSKTDFSIKDDNNNTQAKVRQSGFYLHENGDAGTVQQVDI